MRRHFTNTHALIFSGLALGFMLFAFLAARSGSSSDVQERNQLLTTIGALTGPFAGAIVRSGQACCLDAGYKMLPYCATGLLAGFAVQFLPTQGRRKVVKYSGWVFGLLAWFAGVPISLLHAYS